MRSIDDDVEEHATVMGIGLAWWIIALLVVFGTVASVYWVSPWFMKKDTEITRQSDQYVTTKQAALRELKTSYDALATRLADLNKEPAGNAGVISGVVVQQKSIVAQMREQADLIPDHIPPDIKSFLDSQR
jgi:hypothetical protein